MEKGRNYEDCVGKKYNKLTVKELFKIGRKKMFLCECECGNTIELSPIYILNGNNTSCGCVINKHGLWKHPLYNIWKSMKSRCLNPSDKDYEGYGGRGITMNPDWVDVKKYIEDIESSLGKRPKGMTIDRIDNNKGYYIDNLRYATNSQQNINKRYSNKLGSEYRNIHERIKNGYKYYEIRMKRNGLERMSSCNTLELAVQIRNSWLEEYGKDNAYWTERTKNKIYKEDVYKWKKI